MTFDTAWTMDSMILSWANPAPIVYGAALSVSQLHATAIVAGAFLYSPAAGTVLDAGNRALSVTFTPTDTINYAVTTASVTLTVQKATPTINWSLPADITHGLALGPTQLNATVVGNVAGTLAYSPASGTVLNAGNSQTLSVAFRPADTANYTSVSKLVAINVGKTTPVINWTNPAEITYGVALGLAQLNATVTGSVAGTLVYTPPSATVLSAGSQNLSVTFTPSDTANYNSASKQVTINVGKSDHSITFTSLSDRRFGDPPLSLIATASSGLPISFSVVGPASVAGNTLTITGRGTVTVTASQSGNVNFNPAPSVPRQFNVIGNTLPALDEISKQTINEGSTLTLPFNARDSDAPAQTLTFSLGLGAPAGSTVVATSGILNWTPTEAQGPSTNTIRVRVTDDGIPPLSAETDVVVVVNEVNSPPVLAPIANQTITEGQLLTLTASASDADIPPNTIQFGFAGIVPAGAIINPTTGVFTWTPTELQGLSTNVITIVATDNGTPSLSTNRVFTLTVTEDNVTPVLRPIAPLTINEGGQATFTTTATDSDQPPQTLTFSLGPGAPAGTSINAATGVFAWNTTEANGPSANTIRVRVTDNGVLPQTAEQDVVIVVNEVNSSPTIGPIPIQTVREGETLTFSVSATDPDVPANAIQFSLGAGVPQGVAINPTTGVFIWTPTPAQTPSTNIISFIATDNGNPPLSTNRTATVVVFADNRPPVITAIPPQTVAEGSELAFAATAIDPDLPAQNLTFSLSQVPAGATINPATGAFSWTPSEIQGPATNVIAIRVTDSGALPQRSTNLVTIVVTEVNTAPVLRTLSNQTIGAGDTINLRAEATDADVPLNILSFSLLPGAPVGASINPTNGLFTWTPTPAQSATTNQVTIQVADNGSPALNASGTFTIVVRAGINLPPTISTLSNQTTRENTPTSPIVFTIADPDTPVANLNLVASSSNTNLVLVSNIVFGGAETNRTVTITPVPNQNGTANITITVQENTGGKAASSFELTVAPVGPTITRQPQNAELVVGTSASLSVTVTGTQPLTYQWRFNGTPITGARNSVHTIPSAQETDEGTYTVEVKNAIASVTSADAKLTANVPLRINQQPISQSVLANSSITFALTASGRPPLTVTVRRCRLTA